MGTALVSLLLLCQIAMASGTVGCKLKWWTSVFPFVTVDFPVTTGVVMAVQRDLLITLITSGMDQFRSCFFGEPAPSLPGRRRNLYDPFPHLTPHRPLVLKEVLRGPQCTRPWIGRVQYSEMLRHSRDRISGRRCDLWFQAPLWCTRQWRRC